MLATFGVGQVLWSLFWFFLFVLWLMLLFHVVIDVFRSHDMGGLAKVIWLLFMFIFPFLGVFVYLIARGGKMAEHSAQQADADQAALDKYIRDAAAPGASPASELEKLAALKAQGAISEEEYAQLKAKVIS
jgi:hypothetical protein